ncbi:MAG: hypothetical protein H7326_00080, partial [Bdellovibrionaceae bacterium]|nr:hypothetical protein [Pseudobdellovibrionaceae bacterium]
DLLAEEISEGWSIEYDYVRDRRGSDDVFRLNKVHVVNPRGQKKTLENSPLGMDGMSLVKARWSEVDLGTDKLGSASPVQDLRVLSVPSVIQGKLLKSLLSWAPRMDFISRKELRSKLGDSPVTPSLFSLRARSAMRSNAEFARDIIKKQSFKLMLMAVAMYVYSEEQESLHDWWTSFQDPWNSIVARTNVNTLKEIFPALILPKIEKDVATPDDRDIQGALRDMGSLIHHEKELGGKVRIYTYSAGKFKEVSIKKIAKSVHDAAENDGDAVVFVYPTTKRILIIQGSDEDPAKVREMGLSADVHAGLYEQLEALSRKISK